MNDVPSVIRNAVRALIVREQQVLLLRKGGDDQGERFALPGGSQEHGESLVETLQRECHEEIGSAVTVDELLLVADYEKQRSREPSRSRQLVEFLFSCRLPETYQPHNGPRPDKHQLEVVWVDLQRVASLVLTPAFLARHIAANDFPGRRYAGAFSDYVDSQQHR